VDAAGNIYLWKTGSDTPPVVPATIVEFAAGAKGNVAPIRTVQVAQFPSNDGSGYPEGLAVDANGNIVFAVANPEGLNGTVNSESDQIEIFTPGQSGNATPARTISGPQSQLAQIVGLALDPVGNIYVEMATVGIAANPTILEFVGGANPTNSAAPINAITGSATMLSRFVLDSLAVDAAGNIYVLDYTFPGTETYSLLRFAPGATGDATPSAAIPSQEGVLLALH
jgi:sugar lactone lactonase YvrE